MLTESALSVDEVDAQVSSFRQGDVIDFGMCSWHADTRLSLTIPSSQAEGEPGHLIVVSESDELAILTQTCDLVRSCADRPLVQLSPIVHLEGSAAAEAHKGMRPRYAAVPGVGASAFADLDMIVTVEKSAVVEANRRRGCRDEIEARRFAGSVARKFGRTAFPDDLPLSLRNLTRRIREKHEKDSHEGRALRTIHEIRVTAYPSWESDEIDVFLSFCPATNSAALDVMTSVEWEELVDDWMERCDPKGVIANIDGTMIPLEDLTALEYIESDLLDLDYLSSASSGIE